VGSERRRREAALVRGRLEVVRVMVRCWSHDAEGVGCGTAGWGSR